MTDNDDKSVSKKVGYREQFMLGLFSLQTAWKHSKQIIVFSVIESVYKGLWPVVLAILSGQILQEIAKTITGDASFSKIVIYLILFSLLNLLGFLISTVKGFYFNVKRDQINLMLHKDLINARAHVNLDILELPETQEKYKLAESGISTISWYNDSVLRIVTSVISILGVVGVVLATFPWLLIVLLPIPVVSGYLRSRELRRFRDIWDKAKSHRMRVMGIEDSFDRVSTILEIRLLNLTNKLLKLWLSESKKSIDVRNSEDRTYMIIDSAIKVFETLVGIFVDIWVLIALFAGSISIAAFEQTRSLVASFISSLSDLATNLYSVAEDAYQVRDYYSFVYSEQIEPGMFDQKSVIKISDIELRNASYSYPSADKEALKNINFTIKIGEHVAVVGKNGAGKTTLIRLLLGVSKPINGQALINGSSSSYSASLQGNVSLVMQDFSLFDFLTLGEVVGISDYPNYDPKRVNEALEIVGLKEFVDEVGGLNKNFGYVDDDGIKMSGGQNQRLALARAVYASHDLLVLDEPTSMIDAKDEQEIIENIMQLYQGRSVLIVSHKLSTVKSADRIVVLKNGQISEIGTHKELYKKGTHYYDIFHKQVEAFKE